MDPCLLHDWVSFSEWKKIRQQQRAGSVSALLVTAWTEATPGVKLQPQTTSVHRRQPHNICALLQVCWSSSVTLQINFCWVHPHLYHTRFLDPTTQLLARILKDDRSRQGKHCLLISHLTPETFFLNSLHEAVLIDDDVVLNEVVSWDTHGGVVQTKASAQQGSLDTRSSVGVKSDPRPPHTSSVPFWNIRIIICL